MGYASYGTGAAIVLVAAIAITSAGERAMNWKPAKASITTIDRNCQIIETKYGANDQTESSRTYTDQCNSIDEWEKVRTNRKKDVAGTAVVHVSYFAPQTGQTQYSELKFDGHDDEFYELKAGDEIAIMVDNTDPSKIRKA